VTSPSICVSGDGSTASGAYQRWSPTQASCQRHSLGDRRQSRTIVQAWQDAVTAEACLHLELQTGRRPGSGRSSSNTGGSPTSVSRLDAGLGTAVAPAAISGVKHSHPVHPRADRGETSGGSVARPVRCTGPGGCSAVHSLSGGRCWRSSRRGTPTNTSNGRQHRWLFIGLGGLLPIGFGSSSREVRWQTAGRPHHPGRSRRHPRRCPVRLPSTTTHTRPDALATPGASSWPRRAGDGLPRGQFRVDLAAGDPDDLFFPQTPFGDFSQQV
jgi:hypothetical protein